MKTPNFKNFLLTGISFLGISHLSAQEIPHLHPIQASSSIEKNVGQIITITRIEKPWVASRTLVIKKFIESIPQYAKINGLLTKYYSFTKTQDQFGGIYLWSNESAARNWFNPAWFQRVQKTYKSPGEVSYFWVTGVSTLQTLSETKGNYWSVLSLGKAEFTSSAKGLLRLIYITDERGIPGHLSLWVSEKEAKNYFAHDIAANEFFDTPILLNNQ
jgi:hypothetical protein